MSAGAIRDLRKCRREEMRCLCIARNEVRCRSESIGDMDCNKFAHVLVVGEGKRNFPVNP